MDEVEERYQQDLKLKQQQFHARVRANSNQREVNCNRYNPSVQGGPIPFQSEMNLEKIEEEITRGVGGVGAEIKSPLIMLQSPLGVQPQPSTPPPVVPRVFPPVPPSIIVSLDSGESLYIFMFYWIYIICTCDEIYKHIYSYIVAYLHAYKSIYLYKYICSLKYLTNKFIPISHKDNIHHKNFY